MVNDIHRGIKNRFIHAHALLFLAKRQQCLVQLLDAVDLSAYVFKNPSPASIGSTKECADTMILNVKAVGLVVFEPLLLKRSAVHVYELCHLDIFIFRKAWTS